LIQVNGPPIDEGYCGIRSMTFPNRRLVMRLKSLAAVTIAAPIILATTTLTPPPANAAPIGPIGQSLSLPGHDLTQVQYRRRSRNAGPAVAAGIFGAIVGGIIASQNRPYAVYPYEPYPVYPGYYPVYPRYQYPAVDAAVAYCMRRYRSYDPYSMTYLGYDGYRHACP
jgi:hypothetical protein